MTYSRVNRATFNHLLNLIKPDSLFQSKGKKPHLPVKYQFAAFLGQFGSEAAVEVGTTLVPGLHEPFEEFDTTTCHGPPVKLGRRQNSTCKSMDSQVQLVPSMALCFNSGTSHARILGHIGVEGKCMQGVSHMYGTKELLYL
jgi:hypothetical protein